MLREDGSVLGKGRRAYLDYNSTTPLDGRALEGMLPFLTRAFGNPSGRDHAFGWQAAEAVEEARFQVAALINAMPAEVFFTSGATESANLAIKGVVASPCGAAAATTEHEAVLAPCRQLARGATRCLPVDRFGRLDPGVLTRGLGREPCRLVAVMLANNETGVIHPIPEVAAAVRSAGALLFSDLTQAAGKIPIDVRELGIDLAAFSAHKMYGPKGVGALFVRCGEPKIDLEPLIVGGGQERGLRGGTLNVPGIVGFGEACRIARLEMAEEAQRIRQLRDRLEDTLLAALPDTWVNGDRANRLANTSNITFVGVDARTLIRDMHDIAVSTRSACSSGTSGPSHVLKAMGLTDDEAYASVRFSLGRFTTDEEIDHAIERVIASVRKLRGHHAVPPCGG
jgi:cysteine desulfurase